MRTERFRPLTTAKGPFVSVYVDDSRDTADADIELDAIWRDVRRDLEDSGVDQPIVAHLERAMLHGRPAVGRRGRGIIATCEGVLVNEHLPSPPAHTVVRVSEYPYILPLVDGVWRPAYLFAAVDHVGAEVTLHRGDSVRSQTVDGGGYPVHNPATAGRYGYGDHQRSTEEAIRMNVRAVAERLTELADTTDAEVVFVCGEVRSRTAVVSALPRRVVRRVSQLHAGANGHRVSEDEIADQVEAEFVQLRTGEIDATAQRYLAERGRGSGLAVEGLSAVCASLREGDVDTLIVGDLSDTTVVTGERRTTVAPDADALSDLGEPAYRLVRADEALPFAAVATGASLVRVEDQIAPVDGIAALLRYAPTDLL